MNTVAKLKNYDFEKITLLTPRPLQGGTYFSKVAENGENLMVQTPKIYTKIGTVNIEPPPPSSPKTTPIKRAHK